MSEQDYTDLSDGAIDSFPGENPGVKALRDVLSSEEWILYATESPDAARANVDTHRSAPPEERAVIFKALAQDYILRRTSARIGKRTLLIEPLRILPEGQ